MGERMNMDKTDEDKDLALLESERADNVDSDDEKGDCGD